MNTITMPIQSILFTRVWRSLEQAAVLFVRTEYDAQAAFVQFCFAVNQWVRTTEAGKKLAEWTSQDLNIGDLAGHNAFQNEDLLRLMHAAGVEYVDCHGLSDGQCQNYDHVLIDRTQEVEEETVPVLYTADAAPIRLTGEYGQWQEGARFYRNSAEQMQQLAERFPELPATHELQPNDPRDYLTSLLTYSYLAAYQQQEKMGIMVEFPVTPAKEITPEDFAALVARKQWKLQGLQGAYPDFEFSVAYGAATADGCLYMRAFVPLDENYELKACERSVLIRLQDDLLLEALNSDQPV